MAYEYVVKGQTIKLPVDQNVVAVQFSEPSGDTERRDVIDPKSEVGSFDDRYEVPNEKLTIVPVAQPGDKTGGAMSAAVGALNGDARVERCTPVFTLGSKQVVAPNRVIIGFKSDSPQRTKDILDAYGSTVVNKLGAGNEYVVELPPDVDPFDVVRDVTKHAEVEYAEPDFVTIGSHLARPNPNARATDDGDEPEETELAEGALDFAPAGGNDPFLKFKYAARITQTDVAWQTVTGSAAIKIAIIDDGVDLNHPDLKGAIAGAFDAISGQLNQQPNSWDGHGTACAGLAVARPSNGIGIRGMSNGCSLLAVRIASSPEAGARWTVAESNVVTGIDWAWQNGADVLSNSWGGGLPSNAIVNALERARVNGRNGRGCVIVVAAGNDSGQVCFPANQPNVLAISASNEVDEPKTRNSSDGEVWWGSNFGPEVDLAAPGVSNFTTDITGAGGRNSGNGFLNGDYVKDFNGTSSATPIVAGVAGLVLSANPALTEAQVRRLLTETADKVGQVLYANGRNNQMGQGRVNAYRAVNAAPSFV